jgi:S1-C subfamily serine protease
MTILDEMDEIQTGIRQHAEGAGSSVVGIGQRRGVGSGIVLAEGESAAPPQLGIAIAPRRLARRLRRAVGLPGTEGLLIQQVTEDSPAARAGLSSGDLIVAAAGQPVGGVDDLFDALQGAQGGTLELRVARGADERAVQVVFTPEIEGK